jgi:hypothetical protein
MASCRLEVLTMMNIFRSRLCDETPCSLVQRCLQLQSIRKIEAVGISKMPIRKYHTVRRHVAEDLNLRLLKKKQTNKLHGLSPRTNYTDRATAACRRSDCQLLQIEGATWSA